MANSESCKAVVPTPVVETTEEKAKRGRPKKTSYDELEDSLKEAMAGTGQLLPTSSELDNLNAEELRKTAVKVGVPALGNREELIKALKVKLGG